MRLWHKDLIQILPKNQLLSQWRECCCIARNIAINGHPNHILVNKIMDYDIAHFYSYTKLVYLEMRRRGYKVDANCFKKWAGYSCFWWSGYCVDKAHIFEWWHNDRYLTQCYFNLQEKYDCGGISEEEWLKIGGKKQ
jgi:uncharacterized protein (TIGR02328 family)